MSEDYISQIIEYFKELKGLWEGGHQKAIEEKNHNTTKNFSTFSIILTFLLLALTFTNILFAGLNYSSQQISDTNNLLNNPEIKNLLNGTCQTINLTASAISYKTSSISAMASIISIISYLFFGTLIIFGIMLIFGVVSESKIYKKIEKFGSGVIDLELVITILYSLKIKYPKRLNEKAIKEKLFLFDKLEFTQYYNKLKEVLAELENDLSKSKN